MATTMLLICKLVMSAVVHWCLHALLVQIAASCMVPEQLHVADVHYGLVPSAIVHAFMIPCVHSDAIDMQPPYMHTI